jgi:hypothetical protein
VGAADDVSVARPPGSGLLWLYPRAWRDRYESEVVAMLELARIGRRERVDLIRGAVDARLHTPSRVPAVAAVVAGGLWTFLGAGIVAQPVPPDWPGYLLETLPFAVAAVGVGTLAVVGCWARRSDPAGRRGAIVVGGALVAQAAWAVALLLGFIGIADPAAIALAQAVGALGVLAVGLVLLAAGDVVIGGLLVLAPNLLLFGWPMAWLGYGLAWTVVGFVLLAASTDDEPRVLSPG